MVAYPESLGLALSSKAGTDQPVILKFETFKMIMKHSNLLGLGLAIATLLTACGSRQPAADSSVTPPTPDVSPSAPTTEVSPAIPDPPKATPAPEANPAPETNSAAKAITAEDRTVIPGERVGAVTPTTSRAELASLYDEETLKDEAVSVGEGFTEPGTVVAAGTDSTFTVIWTDESQSQPLRVIDFGPAWKTPEGIGLQTSFADLKAALGKFQLYGFGWDYGGTLVIEGSNLDRYHGNLFIRVQPDKAAIASHPDAYNALLGDQVFAADNPNLEPLSPQVYGMEVYLNSLSD